MSRPRIARIPPAAHISDDSSILEIGIDEAGRGPMFGRLYAAAVLLPDDFDHARMCDSKTVKSKQKLRDIAHYIRANATAFHVHFVEAHNVDEINVLQANMICMHACASGVIAKIPSDSRVLLVVDGNYFTPIDGVRSRTLVKGDAKHSAIAAASILAKDARDAYIADLCLQFPALCEKYGIDTNMGYGTARHLEGIRTHGISQFHRRTFGACQTAELNPC